MSRAAHWAVALLISAAGSWLAAKAASKLNEKANGDVRAGWAAVREADAQNRAAVADERAAAALERMALTHPSLGGCRD